MAARNPSICIDVPAELGAALDALAERRNVARAVIARTALAEAFHLPDPISAGHRRGATPGPHTGDTFPLVLSVTPQILSLIHISEPTRPY